MVLSPMTSTQFPPVASSYPLSFQSTAASLPSLFARRPLFSMACSLFLQNTGVGWVSRMLLRDTRGGTPQKSPLGISMLQTLSCPERGMRRVPRCLRLCADSALSASRRCHLLWRATHHSALATESAALSFHILTNPLTGNPFLFISIQIPRVCGVQSSTPPPSIPSKILQAVEKKNVTHLVSCAPQSASHSCGRGS
jgi:hypothetical protein